MLHPSGTCVDLQKDFDNCGSIDNVCGLNYVYCANGVCGGVPAVQLMGVVPIPVWDVANDVDDSMASVSSPFAIEMYGFNSSVAIVSSNGVSKWRQRIEMLLIRMSFSFS